MQKKIKYSFCFIVDREDPEIVASINYLSWLYNIIFKIPIEVFTETEFMDLSFYDETKACLKYSALFLLSIINGQRPSNNQFWSKISEINQIIPILSFYRGARVISESSIGSHLFNLKFTKETKGSLRYIEITDGNLQRNINIEMIKDKPIRAHHSDNLDNFVLVEQIPGNNKDFQVLLKYKNQVFGIKNGLNIFIGEKYTVIPREDYFLEFNRPLYYLNIALNLLTLLPFPIARLRLNKWPINFRIDDFPSNWNLIQKDLKVLNNQQLRELTEFCRKHQIKVTAMVTPAFITKNGVAKSWYETDFNEIHEILNELKAHLKDEIIELGLHGLSHLTIGKRPQFHSNKIKKLFKILFKQKSINSEFYDRVHRKEIPPTFQDKAIKKGKKIFQEYFGIEPKIFTPPQHMWDSNTEKLLVTNNIIFLSCDMCFYLYPNGHKWRKNPSPIGSNALNEKNLMFLSGTLLTKPFFETLELFHRFGIPFVFIRHNWNPEWLTSDIMKYLFDLLEPIDDKKYMTLGDLGNLLWDYKNSSFEMTIHKSSIHMKLDLKTAAKLTIDDRYQIKEVFSLEDPNFELKDNIIFLKSGNYNFTLDLI